MAVDEQKIRDLERRIRELEDRVLSIHSSVERTNAGSKEAPLVYLYLKDPKNGRVARVSNDGNSALKFEKMG